jgi:hypothetical protein
MFNEQQLLRKFSTIFVNHVLNVVANERLVEVHNTHIEGQDFVVIFEVFKIDLFFFFISLVFILVYKFLNEVSILVVPTLFLL